MAKTAVSIVRVEGDAPRQISLDLENEREASLYETLRRQAKRGELHAVTAVAAEAAKPAARVVKKATKAEEPDPA